MYDEMPDYPGRQAPGEHSGGEPMNKTQISLRILAVLAVVLVAALPQAVAGFDETRSIASDSLTVNNLIGEVVVQGHGGSGFEVVVNVRGKDGSRENIQVVQQGSELSVIFPPDQRKFVYPKLGAGSKTTFNPRGDSWLSEVLGGSGRVEVRGSGSGMEVWADIEIRVPSGSDLRVNLGAGHIEAENVNADVELDTHSGSIEARGIRGDLLADTGSGRVSVEDVDGEVSVDTGSGRVDVKGARGSRLLVDTGSGSVSIDDVDVKKIEIDTGSGRVEARGVSTDSAKIDTGSGSIRLELDRMGDGSYRLDTGSGGITLALPPDASADVSADTGSGGIHLELDEPVTMRHKSRDELSFVIGSGAAKVSLDTGSGGIRIVPAR